MKLAMMVLLIEWEAIIKGCVAIVTAVGTGIAFLLNRKKRKLEKKLEEIDLDEKLSEIDKRRIKELIVEGERKDLEIKRLNIALQDALTKITEWEFKFHATMQEMNDLKREIAKMSLTHK